MQIAWAGQYTCKITAKDGVIVLDPYAPSEGLSPFRAKADVVALTNPTEKSMSHMSGVTGAAMVIDTPGEYSFRTTSLFNLGWHDEQGHERTIMRWEIEGVTLLHVGALNRPLTEAELANIVRADIDVLLVPVGGGTGLTTKAALELVSTVEPRMVIPIHYKLPGLNEKLDGVNQFAKEMGVSSVRPEEKVIVKTNKLPAEDMQTCILQP